MNDEEIKKKISKLYTVSSRVESLNTYLLSNRYGVKSLWYKIFFSVYLLCAVCLMLIFIYEKNTIIQMYFMALYFIITVFAKYINIHFFEKPLIIKKYGINENEKKIEFSSF